MRLNQTNKNNIGRTDITEIGTKEDGKKTSHNHFVSMCQQS